MLDFEILKEFLAFAQYGTLSEAAAKLHTSQPSLSRNMRHLEDQLQVELFEHGKNKLKLNDTGKLAVDYAKKIMDDADLMESALQLYDRQKNTISIGSVAPAPLWHFPTLVSRVYPDRTVTMEIKDETLLLQGLLATKMYQFIILPYALNDERCTSIFYESENLMFCLPKSHPLARRKSVFFKEMDGESFLVLNQIGFWDSIHRKNLPNSHFLVQDSHRDMEELAKSSSIPTFVTDLSIKENGMYGINRTAVPIKDKDAHADFYITCRKEDQHKLANIISQLSK